MPAQVRTMEEVVKMEIGKIRDEPDPVRANLYLRTLHNRNETLFHKLLVDYIAEVAPLIYTPTVGTGMFYQTYGSFLTVILHINEVPCCWMTVCEKFGIQFGRSRGMYFSRYDIGHMASMVYNWPHERVRLPTLAVPFHTHLRTLSTYRGFGDDRSTSSS